MQPGEEGETPPPDFALGLPACIDMDPGWPTTTTGYLLLPLLPPTARVMRCNSKIVLLFNDEHEHQRWYDTLAALLSEDRLISRGSISRPFLRLVLAL